MMPVARKRPITLPCSSMPWRSKLKISLHGDDVPLHAVDFLHADELALPILMAGELQTTWIAEAICARTARVGN